MPQILVFKIELSTKKSTFDPSSRSKNAASTRSRTITSRMAEPNSPPQIYSIQGVQYGFFSSICRIDFPLIGQNGHVAIDDHSLRLRRERDVWVEGIPNQFIRIAVNR